MNEWASLAVSITALIAAGWSFVKVAYRKGADDQRQKDVEKRVTDLETDVSDLKRAVADVPVILEKISGLDRMVTRDLDEVKHALRNLQMAGAKARTARTA